jgi:hypothetical protein
VRVEDETRQRESGGREGREDRNPTFIKEWRARRERGRDRDIYQRELGGKGAVTLGIGGRTTGARARVPARPSPARAEPGPGEKLDLGVSREPGSERNLAPRGTGSGGRPANQTRQRCTPRAWLGEIHPTNHALDQFDLGRGAGMTGVPDHGPPIRMGNFAWRLLASTKIML